MSAPARITFVGHATVLIELGGLRLLTDPVLRPRLLGIIHRHGHEPAAEIARELDGVLISHLHHDHLDFPSLRELGRELPDRRARAGWAHVSPPRLRRGDRVAGRRARRRRAARRTRDDGGARGAPVQGRAEGRRARLRDRRGRDGGSTSRATPTSSTAWGRSGRARRRAAPGRRLGTEGGAGAPQPAPGGEGGGDAAAARWRSRSTGAR